MANDSDEKRFVPWTRETDKLLAKIGAVAGIGLAVLAHYTDSFNMGQSNNWVTVEELNKAINSHQLNVEAMIREERYYTAAKLIEAIRNRERECATVRELYDSQLKLIEKNDVQTAEGVKACRENYTHLNRDLDKLEERVNRLHRRQQ